MTHNPTIDISVIEQIREIQPPGENLVRKIIDLFLGEAERLSNCLKGAVTESDWESVGKYAHSLKSCSANVGAMQVASLSHQLEAACRSGRFSDMPATHSELQEALGSAVAELRSLEA